MQGRIDRLDQVETKYGPMTKITVGAITYGVKDTKDSPARKLSQGDVVSFDAEQSKDGKWWYARNVQVTLPGPPVAPRGQTGSNGGGDDREKRIVRQMALKGGIEIVGYAGVAGLEDDRVWAEIMAWAYKIYQVAMSEQKWQQQVDVLNLNHEASE